MADDQPQPDWKLLPGRPVQFFGLSKEFDRSDLKRAYNRLIKVFKPEKHPDEFQRIRAAYEQLDEQLRYGKSVAIELPTQVWQEIVEPEEPASAESEPTAARGRSSQVERPRSRPENVERPKRLAERIQTEPPREVYRELRDKPDKNPFDYYALALLSDLIDKRPLGFAHWLVEGIAAHPREAALQQLLHAFFHGPQRPDEVPALVNLLPAVARAVPNDRFYPLTEAAWLVVVRELPFAMFTNLLARCEAELRDSQIAGKMVFTIQILRSAMWRDTTGEWTDQQYDFIESNFEQIPNWLEWEVDVLGAAREYRQVRPTSLVDGSLRQQIDRAIVAYFSEPSDVGDREVLAVQVAIVQSTERLLAEFPISEHSEAPLFTLWSWISAEVASRTITGEEPEEVNQDIWVPRGVALLQRLNEKSSYSANTVNSMLLHVLKWTSLITIWLVVFFIVVQMIHVLSPRLDVLVLVEIISGIVIAFIGTYYLNKFVNRRWWHPWLRGYWLRRYDELYRRDMLEFQQRSRVPGQFYRALFEHLAKSNYVAPWINLYVQQDYAPAFLAVAQRFEV